MNRFQQTLLCLTVLFWANNATAEVSATIAGDVTIAPASTGHGIVIIDGRFELGDDAGLRTTLNTDTLTVAIEGVRVGPRTRLMTGVAGEALIAGLMTDYYLRGELQPEYGFRASWLTAFVELKRELPKNNFVHWRAAARRWFFGPTNATSPNVLLPDPFFAIEQTVGWTYWGYRPDPSHSDAHHLFRRLEGFGVGVNIDFHWRSSAARWLTRTVARNDPDRMIGIVTQWAAWGHPLGAKLRLQIEQEARYGVGEDDLTRRRIGGFNPYAVNLAGAAWPAFLSSRVLAMHPSIRWTLGPVEAGLVANLVRFSDPLREGDDSEIGQMVGGGVLVDYRSAHWQADLRVGAHVPSQWTRNKPGFGGFFALGRRF